MTPPPPGRVDIVVVNWNTGHYLRECLRSIAAADDTSLQVGDVVVVDNASTDGSARVDDVQGLRLRILVNRSNRGFAVACNQGARLCQADFLLFLNPDTRLYPDTLRVMGDFLRTRTAEGFGIFGARMVDERGRPTISCSRFPSPRVCLGGMTGLDHVVPAVFPPSHLRPEELRASGPVDQVIGAFFLVRRSLFVELDGFDDGYFLYLEEVDFAQRARRLGWPSYHLTEARVFHAGQVSSAQLGPWRHYLLLCSRTRYMFRHWTRPQAWLLTGVCLLLEPAARTVGAALRSEPVSLRATLAVYRAYARWLINGRRPGMPPPASGIAPSPDPPAHRPEGGGSDEGARHRRSRIHRLAPR
ncbi:glycosyltransferase family 2 protein [Streptomyces aquilus]|uniref:glycosyltransferase family 2 protein n=1 Tax=Streptomyces aquilus TaxID=2548456 RepID=UPI003690D3B4